MFLPLGMLQQEIKKLNDEFKKTIEQLKVDENFVKESNIGGEFMSPDKKERINEISRYQWQPNGEMKNFLSENEVYKFEKTVVASGAFSKSLTDQLGENIPLDTERGYHVHFKKKITL